VAATAVWLMVAGFQPVVRWQLSQEMARLVPPLWFVGMPVDETPWQVVQVPGAMPAWFIVAGRQALVLWQLSQAAAGFAPPL